MCYHDAKAFYFDDLAEYYKFARLADPIKEMDKDIKFYHNNGFDHNHLPVVAGNEIDLMSWGLIPWFTKTADAAKIIRNQTLNAISEEMFDKASYKDALKNGQRCLVPVTGFYEWRWLDAKGKEKQPYFIHLRDQKIFSMAGLYSTWKNPETNEVLKSYTVLTTRANNLMSTIHNNKKRMPVIIDPKFEQDWLNPTLTKEDVLAFCQPFDDNKMEGYTISKRITSKKDPTNVPEVCEKVDSGLLFE
jgi:putative SOS response-associated peptidase YedK